MFATLAKTRRSSFIETRKIVANEHLNPNGTLFGGYLMCWMDEVAFMCARRFSGHATCVTANIDNIVFKTPIRLGEHVILSATVNQVGRTSMVIEVRIETENHKTGLKTYTNSAHLTFVCLNEKFKPIPVPKLVLETSEDEQKNREAILRTKVRKRLTNFLDKKVREQIITRPPKSRFARVEKWVSNFSLKDLRNLQQHFR